MHELALRKIIAASLLAGCVAIGCSKEPAPPPLKTAERSTGVSVDSPTEAPPPAQAVATPTQAPVAPADGAPADRGAANPSEVELLDGVYKAFRNFYADKLRHARDVDELVKGGYLKKAPVAPPGKKIVLDGKNFSVYFAPQ